MGKEEVVMCSTSVRRPGPASQGATLQSPTLVQLLLQDQQQQRNHPWVCHIVLILQSLTSVLFAS
jgi:hypothetical protein